MKRNVDFFKQRKAEEEQEQARLSANLDELKKGRAALDEQINAAIDAGNLSDVEKLTVKAKEQDIRIQVAERILQRKKETSAVKRSDIIAANDEEMKEYQADIDAALKAAEKGRRVYLENLIKAGEIMESANQRRIEYCSLAGVYETDESLSMVHVGIIEDYSWKEQEIANSIKPNGFITIKGLWQ